MGYNELYRDVCLVYKRIAKGAFNFHIKKMLIENLLHKSDTGERGKPVYYSLSYKAKQEQRLRILEHISQHQNEDDERETEEQRRQRMYILLFFLESHAKPEDLATEDKFDEFLAKIHESKKDLVIKTRRKYHDGTVMTYEPLMGFRISRHEPVNGSFLWTTDQSTSLCHPPSRRFTTGTLELVNLLINMS